MGDAGGKLFSDIQLNTRSGTSQGQLKFNQKGLLWKKTGSSKAIEAAQADIKGFFWTLTSRGAQLGVERNNGPVLLFVGFQDSDLAAVRGAAEALSVSLKVEELGVSGRNWGEAQVEGNTLIFKVSGKPAFRIPLKDVGQLNLNKDEVMLEFPIDDTSGGGKEDALVDMGFYVPKDATNFPSPEEETPSAQVFHDELLQHTDTGAAVGDAVAIFSETAVLMPRGRFDIELYLTFLKLVGQAQDYRISYESIVRLFVLPKVNSPQTLVIISLDPPIRKGNTFYPHVLIQFPTDVETQTLLAITDEQLASKNEKCGGRLSKSMEGAEPEVFAKLLRGLANTKLTRTGTFRTADEEGTALRCSYKADDGYLYPLERAFFYVHKPPLLLIYDDIESIEFLRQGGGVLAASAKTFDLNIRVSSQEYLFRGLDKNEWSNLFAFIQAKRLRIENLQEAQAGPGGPSKPLDLGEDIDTGMRQMAAAGELGSDEEDEDEEEDADFRDAAESDGGSSDADDGSGGSESDSQPGSPEERPRKKEKKRPAEKVAKEKPAKKAKAPPAEGAKDGKAKKPRAKKDPNAPKRGLSSYMLYSNDMRAQVKADNPGATFTEMAKLISERWRAIDPETKAKYDARAAKEKARYAEEMQVYKAKKGEAVEEKAAAGSDSEVGEVEEPVRGERIDIEDADSE